MILLPAIASSGRLPATTLSATTGSWLYTTDDEWNNSYPSITLTWTAVAGATDGYVIYEDGVQKTTAAAGATSAVITTGSGYLSTAKAYTVRAKAGSVVGEVSNTKTVNIGRPRLRQTSTTVYNESAQEDYTGTTNGRWSTNFQGSVFNIYVKSVKWEITVPFGSAGNFVTASSVNRNLVLIRPGTDFNVPDDQRETYTYTQSYAGTNTQNGTWGVNPNGTGWSSNSSGALGTFRVDFTMTITGTVPYQEQTNPQVT